ncbi:protein FAM117B-like isoform X1 [Schistocerca nitens]|uniref:protein FAM117B-like isoform X1 n=1 Tax=Schistocerca nitens TaxID=7011 RepID=UPI002119A60B|nr:protein FAM117B-like isoform X1 [Schistocerca nitens]
MSGQGSQRVPKSSPCSSSKQGPMRATLPMSSLLRQGSNVRKSKSNSPTLSPTSAWKMRISPEASLSGQRSPGSLSYKGKSKTLNSRSSHGFSGNNVIRRTASLDTIYLKGQWPKESFYMYCGHLLVDKATQTEEWTSEQRKSYRYSESGSNEDKLEKYIRHRLQRTNKEGTSSRERTAAFGLILQQSTTVPLSEHAPTLLPSTGTNTMPATATVKPIVPRPTMRSSIEGLNQEIERLVLKAGGGPQDSEREEEKLQTYQATPEGHRAPLADLLRSTRSVNTQTPAGGDFTGSSQSSGPPSRESVSPMIPGSMDLSRPPSDFQGGSRGSSPDQETSRLGTSPHINKFLAREPPDGCEKVNLKFIEDTRPMIDLTKMDYCPLKPCVTFELKPSLGSAFYPPQQQRADNANGDNSPAVAPTTEDMSEADSSAAGPSDITDAAPVPAACSSDDTAPESASAPVATDTV